LGGCSDYLPVALETYGKLSAVLWALHRSLWVLHGSLYELWGLSRDFGRSLEASEALWGLQWAYG